MWLRVDIPLQKEEMRAALERGALGTLCGTVELHMSDIGEKAFSKQRFALCLV